MELTGNLYDYPRESIERRKLLRQMRRDGLASGGSTGEQSDVFFMKSQSELIGCLLDLENELAAADEARRMKGA